MVSVRIGLLGPACVEVGGDVVSLPAKPWSVLAMLAERAGATVSMDELLDGVWGVPRADTAKASLRNSVLSVRRALGAGIEVNTETGGYRLTAAAGAQLTVDTETLAVLRRQLEQSLRSGRRDDAYEAVTAALALWRGEPLGGVGGPWAEQERIRLQALRAGLRETALVIAVEDGRHLQVLADLEALVATDPCDERLCGLLMVALHREGRRAAALEVFQRTRRILVQELGIDPGPALTELHQQLLSGQLPASPRQAGPEPARRIPIPAQLPTATTDFTGRADLVHELSELLAKPGAIASISGMGGVGKTTLAVHLAHRVRTGFPDGQLYVDLQGAHSVPRAPTQVLGGFLRALGYGDSDIPDELDERSALFRSAVAGRALLVVLDNAAEMAQVLPLLPGGARCGVLITGRGSIVVPGAALRRLPVLSDTDAVQLFSRIVGAERATAEPEAVRRVSELCGTLPIALRIIAARIRSRPDWTIGSEAERLSAERDDLRTFRVGDIALEAAFRSGYELLDAECARAFRLLAEADVPALSPPAMAAVLDRDPVAAEELCERLVDRGMLESVGRHRYQFHDLMRIFARGCPAFDSSGALGRLLEFELSTARNMLAVRRHGEALLPLLATVTTPGLAVDGFAHSEAILEAERPNYVALYQLSATRGTAEHRGLAADLAIAVAETFSATGPAVDLEGALTGLITALDADRNVEAATRARMALAIALINESGDMPTGLAVLEQARAGMREDVHSHWIAFAHGLVGIAAIHDRDIDRAMVEFDSARTKFGRAGDTAGVRRIWCLQAVLFANACDRRATLSAAARAISPDSPEAGEAVVEVLARGAAGSVLSRTGADTDGFAVLAEALRIAERNGTRRCESIIYGHLAEAHRRTGDLVESERCARLVVDARGADWEQDFLLRRAE